MKYCMKCGIELNDEAHFCSNCGHKTEVNQSIENSGTGRRMKRKYVVISITSLVVILVALVVGFVVYFGGKSDEQDAAFKGELTEEKARELYLKYLEYMASDDFDYRNYGTYAEPNVLKDLLEVTPDEELKAVWEFAKEGEYVTGEYSEDKLIEFFLYMFFQNEWDDLNIDYKEEIDTCIDIVRKADVEIENISENELNTLKYQLSEELSKVMNGKNYPFSNWEDAKYVSFSTSQREHKIILLMVLDDGRWKILSPIVQSLCEIYIKPEDKKERTDDNNADTLQNIINTQLQNLCFDEEIICYSDPTTYKTVDEILNNTNSIDNRYVFENMVLQNVPQKYMSGSEGNYSITTKQSGYTMYVIITGTMKDGYIARVKCAKDDPFIHER